MIRTILGVLIVSSTIAQELPRAGEFPSGRAPLHAEFAISGTILSSVTNEPIRRAVVHVTGRGNRWALTDLTGSFRVSDLPQGQYRIIATKPGFRRVNNAQATMVTLGPSAEQLVVKLDPLGMIGGRVVDSYGEPVEGVLVQAYVQEIVEGRRQIDWSKSSRTDDRGQYRIADLNPGKYILRAAGRSARVRMFIGQVTSVMDMHESFVPIYFDGAPDRASARMLTLQSGQQLSADFLLTVEPAYRISGELTNFSSYRAIEVDLLTRNGELAAARTSVNANSGKFQIADVAPGSYIIRAKQGSGAAAMIAMKPIEVMRSDLDHMRLALVPGITVSATVRRDGASNTNKSNTGLTISLTSADDLSDINDTDRVYVGSASPEMPLEINNVQPGIYDIKVESAGTEYIASVRSGDNDLMDRQSISIEVDPPSPIEIVVRADAGSLGGRVTSGGQPVERAAVVLSPVTGKRPPLTGSTIGGGRFSIAGIAPGDYQLYAFDSLTEVEYSNRAALATLGSGRAVHVEPNGHIEAETEMILTRGR